MINIADIIPYFKEGYVAMDKNGHWYWYKNKPSMNNPMAPIWYGSPNLSISQLFDIAPIILWTDSLIKI